MIRKALIPIAGKATRLMPVTSVMPKAILPLVNDRDQIQSLIHVICKEAIMAGAEHIGLVVSPGQDQIISRYFASVERSSSEKLPAQIEFICQPRPDGFGDAVLRAKDFLGDEPFLLLLGDHIHIESRGEAPCAAQVAKAFDSVDAVAMVGMQTVPIDELSRVGVATGSLIQPHTYRCTYFVEKPDPATAWEKLATEGLPEGSFLAHCGIYVFSREMFNCLSQVRRSSHRTNKEVELADAQTILLKKYPERYFLHEVRGRAYDIGTPSGYSCTQAAFRKRKP